jgi:PQQ-dependent dehydrogenase (s-GDH family)
MRKISIAALSAALFVPMVWGPATVATAQPTSQDPAKSADFTRSVLTTGLSDPFEIIVRKDGMLWVTERTAGRVTKVNPETGAKTTILTIPDVVATPGEQDGLLGMAFDRHGGYGGKHGALRVYLSYTYDGDPGAGLDRRQRIVRYRYNANSERLQNPKVLIEGLLASDDHNGGRIQIGSDGKLYYTIGDRGNNQDLNACRLNEAQRLPTAAEVAAKDWTAYQGKTLRLNKNGTIPQDNPVLAGVRSHVWTYGHRNPQGLVVTPEGTVYSSEQGPKSDDELNILRAGGNYGWPRIAGYQDDAAYVYGNWSARAGGCDPADYNAFVIPDDVPQLAESDFHPGNLVAPVRTFFTVPPEFDFLAQGEKKCGPSGLYFICYPTVAPSNLDIYNMDAIPGWHDSFLMTTLKTGTLFRMPRMGDTLVDGPFRLFRSVNRYRDTAVSRDGTVIYVATDSTGLAADLNGVPTSELENPGAILAFRYTR